MNGVAPCGEAGVTFELSVESQVGQEAARCERGWGGGAGVPGRELGLGGKCRLRHRWRSEPAGGPGTIPLQVPRRQRPRVEEGDLGLVWAWPRGGEH